MGLADGAAGRIVAKTATGAVGGAAGMAGLAAGKYALSGLPGADDYTGADALLDMAYGGLLGGGCMALATPLPKCAGAALSRVW